MNGTAPHRSRETSRCGAYCEMFRSTRSFKGKTGFLGYKCLEKLVNVSKNPTWFAREGTIQTRCRVR